ncbi:MAG: ABC transporter ATP-binding protein [Spirochaetota bacterium]
MADLLHIENLSVEYRTLFTTVRALNKVNLSLKEGESLGLVGETGAGKTTTALAILRLLQHILPPAKIRFQGEDLLSLSEEKIQAIRGNTISMIFQDPMTAINPRMKIIEQVAEGIAYHKNMGRKAALNKAIEMLELVGISAERAGDYPGQFSGGMKQRVVIAIALACEPKLILADEPTTALDVTIQAQILDLIKDMQKKFHTSLLMITHDLGVVAEMCDRVAVLYAGEIVEEGTLDDIFNHTKHPYTKALFDSIPPLSQRVRRLETIPGESPDPGLRHSGCLFAPRCRFKQDICERIAPPPSRHHTQKFRCHFPLEGDFSNRRRTGENSNHEATLT